MKTDLLRQLAAFEAADLLRVARDAGGSEYWFKHSLIQETVYAGLLRPARAELHRRVAAAIETLPSGDEGAKAALLAVHYERAGMAGEAFRYSVIAGDHARQRYAYQEAISFYDGAIALAEGANDETVAGQVGRIYGSRGQARQGTGDHPGALADYEMMLRGARAAGSIMDEAEALTWLLPMRILLRGFSPLLAEELDQALRLGKETGDRWLETRVLWSAGLAYRFSDPPRGLDYLQRAVDMTESTSDPRAMELHGYALNDLSIVQFTIGRFREGLRSSQAAVAVFRQLKHQPMLTDALGTAASLEYLQGNVESALHLATEGRTLARELDNPWGVAYNSMCLAGLAFDRGLWREAGATAGELRDNAARVRFPAFAGRAATYFARLHLELGEPAQAARFALQAAESFGQMGAPLWAAMSKGLTAQAALAAGEDPGVAWQHVASLAEDSPARKTDIEGVVLVVSLVLEAALAARRNDAGLHFCSWLLPLLSREQLGRVEGEVHFWRGHLHMALNQWEPAVEDFIVAEQALDGAQAHSLSWKCSAGASEALAMLGESDRSAGARDRSREMLKRLLDTIEDASLRDKFAARRDVARILNG
jgi:tetratricopeptide (TPR) repeat protein